MIKKDINFVSSVEGLSYVEECQPKPANKHTPKWWKETKNKPFLETLNEQVFGNIKNCPSFPDFFSQGFIIPMWCDTIIRYNKTTQVFDWKTSSKAFSWDVHNNYQFLDDVNFNKFGSDALVVAKANCPWKIITKPGYSVLQLPVFYHYNNSFSVMPGVIDTDMHHTINQQVMVFSNEEEIFIEKGTPFVQYIPFKREDFTYNVREVNKKDKKILTKNDMEMTTSFGSNKQYNKKKRINR